MVKVSENSDSKTALLQRELEIEEEKIEENAKRTKRAFLIAALAFLFLLGNLIYLNYKLYKNKQAPTVNNSISNISPSISPTATISISPTPFTEQNYQIGPTEEGLKEYFISFGSGSTSSIDWVDVGGLQTTLDLSTYGTVDKIFFEASVAVPTANQSVSVRLFNKTDKHPVWNSEVSMNAGDSSYLVSNPIVYDKGKKTYQVQMRTQLGSQANLGQSRLHIVLE